jgi:hypothetical protein
LADLLAVLRLDDAHDGASPVTESHDLAIVVAESLRSWLLP